MTVSRRSQTQARRLRLLSLLCDGECHSGEKLAKRLRVSRAGVWKLIHTLQELGIEIESVPRQGYRLPRAVDLLNRDRILSALAGETRSRLAAVDVLLTVDSTNRYVNDSTNLSPGCGHLCLAELQTAGRGRRGRTWTAPFGSGICMSLGWQFAEAPPTFSALSLAVGVAVIRALRTYGAADVGLKWPNDVLWKGRKLGGILIEMRGESAGPAMVVIGIGLNMRMPASIRLQLAEQQAALITDVHEVLRDATPTRNELAAAVTGEITAMLNVFAGHGFEPFASEWSAMDSLANAPVKVLTGNEALLGTARGVADDGALLVEVGGETRRFVSGEVSLRAVTR